MEEAPRSITRAEGLPAAKAAQTPLRASQKAGQPQFSMAISMAFSRFLPAFQAGSVMRRGFSSKGFSWFSVLVRSLSSYISWSLRSSFTRGLRGRGFVRRDVIAYSQMLVARSQSSTVPSLAMGFRMSMPGRGLCIELSP